MRIKNTSRATTHDFIVTGKPKDGVPPTKSLAPGESDDIDVLDTPTMNAYIAGLQNAGEIEVSERVAEKAREKASASAAASTTGGPGGISTTSK